MSIYHFELNYSDGAKEKLKNVQFSTNPGEILQRITFDVDHNKQDFGKNVYTYTAEEIKPDDIVIINVPYPQPAEKSNKPEVHKIFLSGEFKSGEFFRQVYGPILHLKELPV